jgi:rRNA biogenesis protein RRP5
LDEDEVPGEGAHVQAFVVSTTKKGCFVRLSRKLDGRVILKELCDGFLPNPDVAFPMGRLVVGKIKSIVEVEKNGIKKKIVDLDLRESVLLENDDKIKFEDIELGQKYTGTVTRLEDYGIFVRIDSSDVSGLAHKSECSDKFIRSLSNLYDPGDKVKLLVVKKDVLSKKLGFSLKASHFIDDDDSTTASSVEHAIEMLSDDDQNSGNEDGMEVELHSDSNSYSENDDDSSNSTSSSSDSDTEIASKTKGTSNQLMDTDVGFDWGNRGDKQAKDSDDSSDEHSSDSDEEGDTPRTSHKSRRKQAQRRKEEREIAKRESALADGTADDNPETEADFERLIANDPNSSELWIRFMAFHLSLADISAAREVANRAFNKIEFREESEKMNVWCALLTLELKFGTESSINEAFERACQHNNPKHVHLRFAEILDKSSGSSSTATVQRLDDLYLKMCKKFRTKKKVWLAHMEYLLKNEREEDALAVSKKCVLSLPPYKHVETLFKFAQLVFEYGNVERGRTLFDGLLRKAPKRLDIFFVYTDKEIKYGDIAVARSLFQRVCNPADETVSLKLSDKKMKNFFKKWYAFEEQHGTAVTQERVKEAARQFVERSLA